jgi:AraC family transcriptional regulator
MYLADHTHENAFIAFVLRGAYNEICTYRRLECKCGTAILHPAGETHKNQFCSRGGLVFSMEFGSHWLERFHRVPTRTFVREGRIFELGLQLYVRMSRGDWLGDFDLEEFALAITGDLAQLHSLQAGEARSRWMRHTLELVHGRACETLTLACIAESAGIHPTHLARQFRNVHGCTVGDYIRRLRVQRAATWLLETEEPISHIAQACGFADQSHLTRLFRSALGATPRQLRFFARH